MTKEIIDKCIDFVIGGNKKNKSFYGIKNNEFPSNLLVGTLQQQETMELLEQGKTMRQIGAELNVSAMTISNRKNSFLSGIEFYEEWIDFWEFILTIRKKDLNEIFSEWKSSKECSVSEKIIIGRFLGNCERKNIKTVEELLILYSQNTQREARAILCISHKDFIFDIIKEKIYELLNKD